MSWQGKGRYVRVRTSHGHRPAWYKGQPAPASPGADPHGVSSQRLETSGQDPKLTETDLFRIRFLGAAREVTGSRFLLETHDSKVLFDCGLGQASGRSRPSGQTRWGFAADHIDAVVLTHAHIDHSGMLPRLARDGYQGPVYATPGTVDLLQVLLPDAAWIQEHETQRTNWRLQRQGRPTVQPLYTGEDAERALRLLRSEPVDERVRVTGDVTVRFRHAGHILGAASVEVWVRDQANHRRIVFSGDIGREDAPLLNPPVPLQGAELVVMESTYGNRLHRNMDDTLDEFRQILHDAERQEENVIIPVFAVGRAQEILYHLRQFEQEGSIAPRKVFLDSPMAIDATEMHRRNRACFDPSVLEAIGRGENPFAPERLIYSHTAEDSKAINDERGVIILAGSGMCQGGRVMHHLKHHLWRRGTHVVFVGFQAQGTTGRALVDGAKMVKIRGQRIAVNADIHTLGGFSAHADQAGLLRWLEHFHDTPPVVLVHGEADIQDAFAETIQERSTRRVYIPERSDALVVPRSGNDFRLGSRAT